MEPGRFPVNQVVHRSGADFLENVNAVTFINLYLDIVNRPITKIYNTKIEGGKEQVANQKKLGYLLPHLCKFYEREQAWTDSLSLTREVSDQSGHVRVSC